MNPKNGELATYDPHSRPKQDVPDDRTQAQIAQDRIEASKKTPQFLAREEMAKRTQAAREAESSEFKPDVIDDEGNITAAIETQAPEEPQGEPFSVTPEPEVALETLPEPDPEEFRELVVNGQKIKVPVSKILEEGMRAVQKESAADMKLAAASQLERQLQDRLAQFEKPPSGATPEPTQQEQQPSRRDAGILAKAIQFGTEDEAKTAIEELMSSKGGITKDEALQIAREAAAQEREADRQRSVKDEFDRNQKWAQGEFKHIFGDPDLKAVFAQREQARRDAGDTRHYRELYPDIAKEMETKFHLQRAEAIATGQPAQDRITRKATAPRPVSGASTRGQAAPPARAPTVTDYVQRQRELRGQVPLNRNNQGI